jgi:hypothetical protein
MYLVIGASYSIAKQKGSVTAVKDKTVQINWGTYDGIVPGVAIDVYREKVITHTATGERLATQLELIGTIEVTECQLNTASSVITRQSDQIRAGDILKISFSKSEKQAVQQPKEEKGTIRSVNNAIVTFSLGKADGVEKNFYFDIYRVISASVHPITGAALEPKKSYIGRLIVTSVDDQYSTGQVIHREQDVQVGDKVELSKLQAGDIEIEKSKIPPEKEQKPKPLPVPEQIRQQAPAKQEAALPVLADNIVGTIKRVSGKDLYFVWKAQYEFPLGRVFGIFRQVEIKHPKTGFVLEKPFIQIGTATLRESISELGKAVIASNDADILPNDLIGLMGGETAASKQVITPENAEQVYTTQSSDIMKSAQTLAERVNRIDAEMTVIRSALDRLNRIDRELAVQKTVSTQTLATLNEIKTMLSGEGVLTGGSFPPQSRASAERLEIPGSKTNVLRLQYTNDIGVDFQLVGNRLVVSLAVDTTGLLKLIPKTQTVEAEPIRKQTDTTQQITEKTLVTAPTDTTAKASKLPVTAQPFWKNWINKAKSVLQIPGLLKIVGILAGVVVLLSVIYAVIKKLLLGGKRKKKEPAEEGEEIEESGEDAIEEEVIPEEEEVGTFEESES